MKVVGVGLLRCVGVGRGPRGIGALLLGEIGGRAVAVSQVVVVRTSEIDRPLVVEPPLQFLADVVAVIAGGHGAPGEFQHRVVPLLELLIAVHLPRVGLVMGVGRLTGEMALIDVDVNVLVHASVVQHAGGGGSRYGFPVVVCDDVDDAGDGVRTIEGRCRPAEYLYAADVVHRDAAPAVVARYALAVFQNDDIVVAHAVEVDERAHAVGVRSHGGGQFGECILQVGDLCIAQFLGRDDLDGHR